MSGAQAAGEQRDAGTLGLDPALLEILACPDTHHSPLSVDLDTSELV